MCVAVNEPLQRFPCYKSFSNFAILNLHSPLKILNRVLKKCNLLTALGLKFVLNYATSIEYSKHVHIK